ncbi:hypothetical protein AC1031_016018 [Aphanomyces cochlioides]|nr:hypothetical protein AC1031_016018 [Aphanomyces cochlioides]
MAKVELYCALFGEATVFPVKIALDAEVSALQLFDNQRYGDRFMLVPSQLTLYLARKEGAVWLKDDHDLKNFLQGGVSTEYEEMRPTWKLDEDDYFGKNFQPGSKEIQVLVELPQVLEAKLPRDRQLMVCDVQIPVTQSMLLNPPALVALWKAFRNDKTNLKAGALVELPQATYLLGSSTLGSRLYIRHCYPALWEYCLKTILDEKMNTPHLVILGNPGIGKTFFGFLILLLVREGATVVYESGVLKQRFLLTKEIVAEGSPDDFIQILKNIETYYIVDAVKPAKYDAKTILLTSPRRSICVVTRGDSTMSRADVVGYASGCRARLLSTMGWYRTLCQQVLLENAIDMVDLDWLAQACCRLDADDAQVAHRLLHYRVSETFDKESFVFASDYVQQMVFNRLYMKDKRKLLDFIDVSGGLGTLPVLRGHLFEGHDHSVLP